MLSVLHIACPFFFINEDSVFDSSKMPIEEKTNKTKHKQGNVPIQHNKEETMQHHTSQKAQTRHHPPARLPKETVDDAEQRQRVLVCYYSQRKCKTVDQTHGICGVVYVPFPVLHVYTAVSSYICLWVLLFS
jgi:hypothetical protein